MQNSDKNNYQNFNLPQNYFNNSAQSIKNKIECIEELKDYKILSEKLKTGLIVPQNYFQNNQLCLENINYSTLNKVKLKQNCFNVPENYFKNSENLISKIVMDTEFEFEKNNLLKQNSFQLPDNYFKTSANQIKQNLKPKTKIISLNFSKTVLAMAASVIIVLSIVWFNKFYTINTESCGNIACVDVKELKNSKIIENMETEELYDVVNVNELENALNLNTPENKENDDSIKYEFVD